MAMASSATAGLSGAKVKHNPDAGTWIRPSDWLPLPAVAGTEQKFVALHAVWNHDSNFACVNFAGAYTVDWGDGTVENFATGVNGSHTYTWANISAATTTSAGFRQVIVTVTPQAGQSLTSISLGVRHPTTANAYGTGWLDMRVAGSLITSLQVQRSANFVNHKLLTQFEFVRDPNAAVVAVNMDSCFLGCSALVNVLGLPASITGTALFSGCSVLQKLPTAINMATATSVISMFLNCAVLTSAPQMDTSNCTNFSSMFNGCSTLRAAPALNTAKGTTFNSMFLSCANLRSVPLYDTSSATNLGSMLSGCSTLASVPLFDTHNATDMSSMFSNCYSLTTVPLFNTVKVTTLASAFSGCNRLITIPLFVTSACTNMSNIFNACTALQIVPSLDMSLVTVLTTMFGGCGALSVGALSGTKVSISYASCRLSATQLNAVYSGLATVASGTITVTSNPGVAGDDPSIATAKGWTVTGS